MKLFWIADVEPNILQAGSEERLVSGYETVILSRH